MGSSDRVEAILFDLYDTLVQLDWRQVEAERRALAARAGLNVELMMEQWRRTSADRQLGALGDLSAELVHMTQAAGAPALAPALIAELVDLEYQSWQRAVQPYPDSLPYLRHLRRAGYRLAIVSNCSCQAAAMVRTLKINELVDVTTLSCEVGVAKPDPAILALTLERLGGTQPERAVLVDDLVPNLDAARALGLRTVLMVRGERPETGMGDPPHPCIRRLDELTPLLVGAAA